MTAASRARAAPQSDCFEQSLKLPDTRPGRDPRQPASEGDELPALQLDSLFSASDNAALGGTGIGHVRQVLREDIFGTPCPSTAAINAGEQHTAVADPALLRVLRGTIWR